MQANGSKSDTGHQLDAGDRLASSGGAGSGRKPDQFQESTKDHLKQAAVDERGKFLPDAGGQSPGAARKATKSGAKAKKAKLAREESFGDQAKGSKRTCFNMTLGFICRRKWSMVILVSVCFLAAIYCIPYIEIETQIPLQLPHVPFNFKDGPLRASKPSQFQVRNLFRDLIHGPESIALDSAGNMYMAIEGGFVLQARINSSSAAFKAKRVASQPESMEAQSMDGITLTKIAELNPLRQVNQDRRMRSGYTPAQSVWRRECQLDEKLYGPLKPNDGGHPFSSHIIVSRCSKPLGVRLSKDESHLYIVDTLAGLYRVSLRVADKANPSQRLVTKLIDFRVNKKQLLPVYQPDQAVSSSRPTDFIGEPVDSRPRRYLNVTLKAVDDLIIDHGAGTRGADLIYLSDASQNWQATSFFYDLVEGRPSGVILRYDTGLNHLSVLNPSQVAHVRTSALDLANSSSRLYTNFNSTGKEVFLGIGAPLLNEEDVFDDRPLYFPNGLEIMDDKEAILIADTSNKRIIKHYIRGPRKGTSDLWAWTPNYPDNIRRGVDPAEETYWVVGCGEDNTDRFDLLAWLREWPRLRKFILKNIFLVGVTVETIGLTFGSVSLRDAGYSLKVGNSLCQMVCQGMMILQYNRHGDIIRSIYSHEFPNDLAYYSQVNEVVDTENSEHILYLSSPAYSYVTKLVVPIFSTDSTPNDVVT